MPMIWQQAAYLAALALTGYALKGATVRFLTDHRLTRPSYKGTMIPGAAGMLMWLLVLASWTLVEAGPFGHLAPQRGWGDYVVAFGIVALSGFVDDCFGDTAVKGLAGHWRALRQGIVTTGAIKAAAALWAAVVVTSSYETGAPARWTGAALIVLMTNAVNLLDVRPGRALKGFAAAALPAIGAGVLAGTAWDKLACMAPVLTGAVALVRDDLRGKLMLGDTGANALGFAAGCWLVWFIPWPLQICVILLLIGLHMLTMRRSLTAIIAGNRLLEWLDQAGRNGA